MLSTHKHDSTSASSPRAPLSGRRGPAGPVAASPRAGDSQRELDAWARLERFLAVGIDGSAYHPGERELTIDHASIVTRCLASDGLRTITRIGASSRAGRAPETDPAIFSLAAAAKLGDEPTRRAAYAAVPDVCRTGADLMRFADYAQRFGGWGRGMRKAVGAWFNTRTAGELALELAEHPARDGWSQRDLLRLSHPRAATSSHDRLFAWAIRGELPEGAHEDPAFAPIVALHALRDAAQAHELGTAARLLRDQPVPLACVPPALLGHAEVWDALLPRLSVNALLGHLAVMTRVGLLSATSHAAKLVVSRLRDRTVLRQARVHPFALLAALVAYRAGRGGRGQGPWLPVASIVDALDDAFYASFGSVEPTGKRTLIALDISGSMSSGSVAGIPGLTPRIASAAMALVTSATENSSVFIAFTAATEGLGGKWGGGTSGVTTMTLSPHQRLDEVVDGVGGLAMGGTDCALPMLWAQKHRVDVDTFVVYTDNETWSGDVHPVQALRAYRDARGIPAKLVVVGMTSHGFSVADPSDAGMLDVVGFDTSTPPVIADFARA